MRKVLQVYNKQGVPLFATIRKDGTLHFSGLNRTIILEHFKGSIRAGGKEDGKV